MSIGILWHAAAGGMDAGGGGGGGGRVASEADVFSLEVLASIATNNRRKPSNTVLLGICDSDSVSL